VGNLTSRNSRHPSVVKSEKYFDILNHLGGAYNWDGQTDEKVAVSINGTL